MTYGAGNTCPGLGQRQKLAKLNLSMRSQFALSG